MANYEKPVIFKLESQSYGIDINKVASIEVGLTYTPVPNTAPYIKGIMNLRGDIIPVFDLKSKFNLASEMTGAGTIVVNLEKTTIGIPVDVVEEIQQIDKSKIVDMPTLIKKEDTAYFDRVANYGDKLIVLLDIDALIPLKDQESYRQIAEEFANENGD